MNESIRKRELTMTTICKMCEHQYGTWRPRCPACGEATPVAAQPMNPPRVVKQHKASTSPQCTFCSLTGAKQTCAICQQPIHATCAGLHTLTCQQFQQDVAAETAKLEGGIRA